jgi:hypothetical protein
MRTTNPKRTPRENATFRTAWQHRRSTCPPTGGLEAKIRDKFAHLKALDAEVDPGSGEG